MSTLNRSEQSAARQSGKLQGTWTLRSPVDGVVRKLSLREGMSLPAGSTMVVINGTDWVWLEVALPEAPAGGVQAGHYVLFDEGTDLYWTRSRVLEYLNQVQGRLPAGGTPSLGPDATGVGWIYHYALADHSGPRDVAELRSLQDWFLKYELQALPGIAEVAGAGAELSASLPEGVEIVTTYDRGELIDNALSNLSRKLIEEFIVVDQRLKHEKLHA